LQKTPAMPATFFEHEARSGLKDKRKLSVFIDGLISRYRKNVENAELDYIFCNDKFLLEMNNNFLAHDAFTDIITFDLSESKKEIQGEIYISVERVKDNAKKFRTTYTDELHRVIFHGVLHLCGFKDKKEKDRKIMRENEDYCLAQYKKELKK
jgi:probable rRNA maturation factor